MPPSARPTAVLTDDHPAVLSAIVTILEPVFDVVALTTNGMQAFQAVVSCRPQLLVLDVGLPGWNGFETAERAMQSSSGTKLLFLTVYEDPDYIERARQLGASYVFKRRMGSDLLKAAMATLAGSPFCSGSGQ